MSQLAPHCLPQSRDIFWGEIAPCEHLVEIYGSEEAFIDSLEGFVIGGLRKGESVVIIATPVHRQLLDQRLAAYNVNVGIDTTKDHFISLDAEETLSMFMVNEWPDEERFTKVVSEILKRARRNGRGVRAFGEMVAILWARGQNGATVRLEHLWHQFCRTEAFSLFCAYPKSGFTKDTTSSIKEICRAHSRVVSGWN